jgi:hypothetical protein
VNSSDGTARVSKQERLHIANKIIELVSGVGRKFFFHHGRISRFELDARGRVWLIDGYTQKRIYVMYRSGSWRGFSEGGTLRSLICNLADFIAKGERIRNHFGPWPETLCDGDLWGYGKDQMESLRQQLMPYLAAKSVTSSPEQEAEIESSEGI